MCENVHRLMTHVRRCLHYDNGSGSKKSCFLRRELVENDFYGMRKMKQRQKKQEEEKYGGLK
jgi:hypothetical protein